VCSASKQEAVLEPRVVLSLHITAGSCSVMAMFYGTAHITHTYVVMTAAVKQDLLNTYHLAI